MPSCSKNRHSIRRPRSGCWRTWKPASPAYLTSTKQNRFPFGAEAAALRLASFYRRESRLDDVRRVLLKFRDAFVAAARLASGMVAYAWIERVHAALHDQGVAREANALEPLLREHGKRSTTEMKGSGVSVTIPADDISESLMTSAPMIRALLSKETERLPLTLDLLMAQVWASPVFAEDRHAIIELGSLLFSEKISRFTFECCCPISVAGISGMTSVTDCSPGRVRASDVRQGASRVPSSWRPSARSAPASWFRGPTR